MSRRAAGPDKTLQNQQTLKSLVKLEGNKSCADCKKNKHPRWASWNLGIFICIRCSGIHRGMGTHISRVKSVDLDSWTDEQMQSMLRWGNARANKYWESKLAPGHVPADGKIENFIRTKYDSKRWVMDGPMPDPSTLGEGGDDDVPLNVVQEKAKLDRSASLRNTSISGGPSLPAPPKNSGPVIDLFGDDPGPAAAPRANTAEPAITARAPPPKAPMAAAPPKQNRPGDSLLGLDFFGTSQSAPPARPASAASGAATPGSNPRSDLKQSILSLYASAPKPAPTQSQSASNAFGGMTSPSVQSPGSMHGSTQSFGGLSDAFGGLNFGPSPTPTTQQQPPKPSAFSNLSSPAARPSSISGGSFFDAKPAPPKQPTPTPAAAPRPQAPRVSSGFGDFGDFTSAPSPAPAPVPVRSPAPVSSGMGDLFDMSAPEPATPATSTYNSSAFNLSTPAPPKPTPKPAPALSGFDNMDAWGSSNAWSTSEPAAAPAPAPPTTSYKAPATTSMATNDDDFGGWGSNEGTSTQPTVTQDDDFGGWSSAPAPAPAATSTSSSKAAAPSDDLFGNVWG